MARAEDLLTDVERLAINSGDELLEQEIKKAKAVIERARTLGELVTLVETLGLSEEASREFIVAFRERMGGIEFDPALELGRIFNNVTALLPSKADMVVKLPIIEQTEPVSRALGVAESAPAEIVDMPIEIASEPVKKIRRARLGLAPKDKYKREKIDSVVLVKAYLESVGAPHEDFHESYAAIFVSVIVEFANIRGRSDGVDHRAILTEYLSGHTRDEIAKTFDITTNAINNQLNYIKKKVLLNPQAATLRVTINRKLKDTLMAATTTTIKDPAPVVQAPKPVVETKKAVPAAATTLTQTQSFEPRFDRSFHLQEASEELGESVDTVQVFSDLLSIDKTKLEKFLGSDKALISQLHASDVDAIVDAIRGDVTAKFASLINPDLKLKQGEKVALYNILGVSYVDGKLKLGQGMSVSRYIHPSGNVSYDRESFARVGLEKLASALTAKKA